MSEISYRVGPGVSDRELNDLFACSWPSSRPREWGTVLAHSLTYVCAYDGESLIGFVHIAWDGDCHGFVLDPTVHADYRRRGVGTELLRQAAGVAGRRGIEWLHVDYEAELAPFYRHCGYVPTEAGLLRL